MRNVIQTVKLVIKEEGVQQVIASHVMQDKFYLIGIVTQIALKPIMN